MLGVADNVVVVSSAQIWLVPLVSATAIPGTTGEISAMVMLLLVAVGVLKHKALDVTTHVNTSPLAGFTGVKFVPTNAFTPFIFHW